MRMIMIVAAFAAVAAPVSAQPLQAQLSRCLAIPGVLQRLACYDSVAKGAGIVAPPVAAAPAYRPLPTAPLTSPAPVASYVPPPRASGNDLGAERLPQTSAYARPVPGKVVAEVTKFTLNPHGKFTVELANGQVWKQIESDDGFARARKGMRTATVERALIGSFALQFNDSNQMYKVTRLQ